MRVDRGQGQRRDHPTSRCTAGLLNIMDAYSPLMKASGSRSRPRVTATVRSRYKTNAPPSQLGKTAQEKGRARLGARVYSLPSIWAGVSAVNQATTKETIMPRAIAMQPLTMFICSPPRNERGEKMPCTGV